MTSHSPELPVVCFLCLDSFQAKEKATALDLDMLSQKFLGFTENHLDIPSEEWALDKARLKNALCFNCSSVISVLCSLYDNLCDVQAKLEDKMEQLSSLLEGSKERMTRRKGKSLMETLERQLGVDGSDGKKVEEMRDLLGDKCKIYSKKTSHQNTLPTLISEEDNDGGNSEAGDNDSVDVKIENNSINGSGDDENYDYFTGNSMDEQDPDHSATSDNDDDKNFDKDDDDSDFNLEKGTSPSPKKSPAGKGPFGCELCGKDFNLKTSVRNHMKNIHGNNPPKPEKSFSCKLCPNKYGTRNSLISHISFKHRGHSILNKPFKCDICSRGFTTQNGVILHKKKMHTVVGPPLLQNDSSGSLNLGPNNTDKKDQDYSAPTSSSSSSYQDDNTYEGEDDADSDDIVEKETPMSTKKSHDKRYSTEMCGKWIITKSSIIPPKSEKSFSCKLCPNKYGTRNSLISHISFKHRGHSILNKPFKCDICGRGFTTQNGVVLHKKKIHKKEPPTKDEDQEANLLYYSCTECSMSFETRRQKVHHTYTVHKKDKQTGGFMKRVQDAMRTDSSDQTEQSCVVCSQEFKSWKLLHSHLKVHEKVTANKKSQMCYFCDCLFCYEQSVWAHLKTCITHNFTTIEFPCDHADHLGYKQWVFKNPIELETHFKEDHGDCEVFSCGDCGWPFLDKNMLEFHRLVHLPKIKSKYRCPGCSNTFLNTNTLQHHFNSIHGVALKLYRCKNCNMGFDAKAAIAIHSSRCRGGGNEDDKQQALEFLCSECPKSYETAYQLKNHVRTIHTTVQCPDCGVMLTRSQLVNHKITKHGEDKFLCTLCGKAYRTRALLRIHMSAHGQYRWKCKYCGSGSRSLGHLRRHIGRMHKDKLAEEATAKNIKH